MVRTFRKLVDLADFSGAAVKAPAVPVVSTEETTVLTPSATSRKRKADVKPTLQLNIEIHIAADTPDDKIETIFRNMNKYLLNNE